MDLSTEPAFTHRLLRRLRMNSHMGILRHKYTVHSIDCNNKLAPFRDYTFYYQKTRGGRKYCLNFITSVIHGYSVLFSAAGIAMRLPSVWFLNSLASLAVVLPGTVRAITNFIAQAWLHLAKQGISKMGAVRERDGQRCPKESKAYVLALTWSQWGLEWGGSSETSFWEAAL